MYRNSEGYSDPTAGKAFAHISYEARKKRRAIKEAEEKRIAEIRAKELELCKQKRKEKAKAYREKQEKNQHWTLAWPKPNSQVITFEEGKQKNG